MSKIRNFAEIKNAFDGHCPVVNESQTAVAFYNDVDKGSAI